MPASRIVFLGLLLSGFAGSASADVYDVTVNTSSIAGTAGSLDFNFNPGPLLTQSASLQIENFVSNGSFAGIPALTGDVAGALPSTLTFDNRTGFNDYFEGFTYGTALGFQVSLYGPAISSPDGVSMSGSTFAFSMFSDPAGTFPALTTDTADGFAITVDINLDGTTTLTNYVPTTSTSVPEPSSASLTLVGVAIALATLHLRQRRGCCRG